MLDEINAGENHGGLVPSSFSFDGGAETGTSLSSTVPNYFSSGGTAAFSSNATLGGGSGASFVSYIRRLDSRFRDFETTVANVHDAVQQQHSTLSKVTS